MRYGTSYMKHLRTLYIYVYLFHPRQYFFYTLHQIQLWSTLNISFSQRRKCNPQKVEFQIYSWFLLQLIHRNIFHMKHTQNIFLDAANWAELGIQHFTRFSKLQTCALLDVHQVKKGIFYMHVVEGRQTSNLLYVKKMHRPPPDLKLSEYFLLWRTQYGKMKILQAVAHWDALPTDWKGW